MRPQCEDGALRSFKGRRRWLALVIVFVALVIAAAAIRDYSQDQHSVCQENGVYEPC